MDQYHSSAIFKGSSIMYKIPITTQHDARQRCPALIVLKEDNNNNNNHPRTRLWGLMGVKGLMSFFEGGLAQACTGTVRSAYCV